MTDLIASFHAYNWLKTVTKSCSLQHSEPHCATHLACLLHIIISLEKKCMQVIKQHYLLWNEVHQDCSGQGQWYKWITMINCIKLLHLMLSDLLLPSLVLDSLQKLSKMYIFLYQFFRKKLFLYLDFFSIEFSLMKKTSLGHVSQLQLAEKFHQK